MLNECFNHSPQPFSRNAYYFRDFETVETLQKDRIAIHQAMLSSTFVQIDIQIC